MTQRMLLAREMHNAKGIEAEDVSCAWVAMKCACPAAQESSLETVGLGPGALR